MNEQHVDLHPDDDEEEQGEIMVDDANDGDEDEVVEEFRLLGRLENACDLLEYTTIPELLEEESARDKGSPVPALHV
jgi:hypothetical protein